MRKKRGKQTNSEKRTRGKQTDIFLQVFAIFIAVICCVCMAKRIEESAGLQGRKANKKEEQKQEEIQEREDGERREAVEVTADGNFIKWVDFNVTSDAMAAAYDLDVETYLEDVHLNWIELLAYVGTLQGGSFDKNSLAKIRQAAEKLRSSETTMEELTKDLEYYDYYKEAYSAVLGGMVGEFSMEADAEDSEKTVPSVSENTSAADKKVWKNYYGLKAFLPIARGFDYNHYDDFGSSRSYGYARPHLGHDMMGQIGTPIRIKY